MTSGGIKGFPPRFLTPVLKEDYKRSRGDNIIDFSETLCKITKDSVAGAAGEPLVFRGWQKELTRNLFAVKKDGRLKHKVALIGLPRKNGKSAWLSALALEHLVLGPQGGETYSCAAEKEQAKMKGNTEELLLQIKDYGYKTLDIIESQNFDQYGLLMHDYWELKKKLSSGISLNSVDCLYEELRKNYNVLGGKIIGAGGGGFFMMYVYKNHKKLEEYMKSIGYSKLEFAVDYTGSKILGNYI